MQTDDPSTTTIDILYNGENTVNTTNVGSGHPADGAR
jgi:hypothetical protein